MALLTADIAAMERATYSLDALADSLRELDTGGAIHSALTETIMELADESTQGVQAAVPRGPTGRLARSVKKTLFPYRTMAFRLRAGAKNAQGLNYGWFTELGTDEAAGHAVDAIGYVHTGSRRASTNGGIPAQYWFSRPVSAVLKEAPKRVSEAIVSALDSLFRR